MKTRSATPPPNAPTPALLSIPEACGLLTCSRSQLYVLMGRGEIPAVKIGRLTRIRAADIESWIAQLPEYRVTNRGARKEERHEKHE